MVSVLIPAYNAEKTIHRCLDSVLSQTMGDIEVIVVNDGSKDNTWDILLEYDNHDKRVKVFDQQNQGVAATRNTLLNEASGDCILFVDADDWIEPDMLERMTSLFEDADIVFCGSDYAEDTDSIKKVDLVNIEVWDQERQLLEFMKHKRMTGMLWNKLFRKSVVSGCSFNPQTGYGEDAEFLWQVLKQSHKMVVTNEILYHHVLDGKSISHQNFSDKKYSAILMWERLNIEVKQEYPELLNLARERLTSVAVFSFYECRRCGYNKFEQIKHMRSITREHLRIFLLSPNVSKKLKMYALFVAVGI